MSQLKALHILVVDDDAMLLRATELVMTRQGWQVTTARDGLEAREKVKHGAFDVIVSDINMPGAGGLEFLRSVRERDLDVPVILMTGKPSLETSIRAVEYGAFRYLLKPVPNDKLVTSVRQAARLHQLAMLTQQAMELSPSSEHRLREGAALEVRLAKSIELLWMANQPIVSWSARTVHGHEALLRSDDTLLNNPAAILDAAERLGQLHELGRSVRARVAANASGPESGGAAIFVNLHSSDLNDEQLFAADSPLSKIAHRVVLEVTERASLHGVRSIATQREKLRAMGFRIAIDDLGAGYAGLTSFTLLEPEVAKLDMSLVRGVDVDPKRQSIIRSMKSLCDELGILVVSEGVETVAERDMLASLGCDLLQGYLFAKPGRGYPQPIW